MPTLASDEGHRKVRNQASEWQKVSVHAEFWEGGAVGRGTEEGRVFALVGQMAAVGEQLGLASATALEVALWQDSDAAGSEVDEVVKEMSIRALAEAQCLFVLGAGHSLANVAAYTLALDERIRGELTAAFGKRTIFKPFSSAKSDWISLNARNADRLRRVSQATRSTAIATLIIPIADLGESEQWRALLERRGEDFHRWRLQSHGVAGVPRQTPWHKAGKGSRSLPVGVRRDYRAAEGLATETSKVATDAMRALSHAMGEYMQAWPKASSLLGGPRFREK